MEHSDKEAVDAQIHADHQLALELEHRLNEEAHKSKKLAKETDKWNASYNP